MTRRRFPWRAAAALIVAVLATAALARLAHAGSSEPKLAIATATASVEQGVVTIEIVGNFDYDNAVRLGYPLSVLVTRGATIARMLIDGRVGNSDVWTNLKDPTGIPGAPGVVAMGPERLTVVLPPELCTPGIVTLRLEALFVIDGSTTSIRSNAVEVAW